MKFWFKIDQFLLSKIFDLQATIWIFSEIHLIHLEYFRKALPEKITNILIFVRFK